ncbi:DUF4255 domain-containing protein [Desulfocastanea catecholica]
MSLLDLSLVTRTFTKLLETRIPLFPEWPAGTTLTVSAGAPDLVNATYGLSFYLYHVREDAHTKSQDWQADDPVPQRFKPMGLSLFYVLAPRSNIDDANQRALTEQLIMGLALKTLHDMPYIDNSSSVMTPGGPVLIMPTTMRGRQNRLRIQLRPTPVEDASQYWQAGTQPMRLTGYYEVAATLLQPDEPSTRRGRVLTVGVHTLLLGQPIIESTRNMLTFTLPGELDARTLELSPAEVPYGATLELVGADLKGDRTALLLNHRDFAEPVEVDAAWALVSRGDRLTVTVQPNVGAQALIPGIYGAIVQTTKRSSLPNGSQRDFDAYSNEAAFVIAPSINTSATNAGVITLTMNGFEPHGLSVDEISVFVGSTRLTRTAANPPTAGQFHTPVAPIAEIHDIRLRMPAGTTPGSILPIRIIIRDAESGPHWEVAP